MDVKIASHTFTLEWRELQKGVAPATFAKEMFAIEELGGAVTQGSRRCHDFVTLVG
jgi:hypothetical protein